MNSNTQFDTIYYHLPRCDDCIRDLVLNHRQQICRECARQFSFDTSARSHKKELTAIGDLVNNYLRDGCFLDLNTDFAFQIICGYLDHTRVHVDFLTTLVHLARKCPSEVPDDIGDELDTFKVESQKLYEANLLPSFETDFSVDFRIRPRTRFAKPLVCDTNLKTQVQNVYLLYLDHFVRAVTFLDRSGIGASSKQMQSILFSLWRDYTLIHHSWNTRTPQKQTLFSFSQSLLANLKAKKNVFEDVDCFFGSVIDRNPGQFMNAISLMRDANGILSANKQWFFRQTARIQIRFCSEHPQIIWVCGFRKIPVTHAPEIMELLAFSEFPEMLKRIAGDQNLNVFEYDLATKKLFLVNLVTCAYREIVPKERFALTKW